MYIVEYIKKRLKCLLRFILMLFKGLNYMNAACLSWTFDIKVRQSGSELFLMDRQARVNTLTLDRIMSAFTNLSNVPKYLLLLILERSKNAFLREERYGKRDAKVYYENAAQLIAFVLSKDSIVSLVSYWNQQLHVVVITRNKFGWSTFKDSRHYSKLQSVMRKRKIF